MEEIKENVAMDATKPVSELLDEIYTLRKKLNTMKRAESRNKQKNDDGDRLIFDRSAVKKAIIYSEIIGPAKSKRK